MAFRFVLHRAGDAVDSFNRQVLHYIRIFSFLIVVLYLFFKVIFSDFDVLGAEISTIASSIIFEIFALGTYFIKDLGKLTCIVFEICWTFSTTICVFQVFYFEGFGLLDMLTYLPWVTLLADYIFNRISIYRTHYVFPLIVIIIYTLSLSDPSGQYIYEYSTFQFVLIFFFMVFLAVGVLELSRVIKTKTCSETQVEQKLL